MSGYNSEISGFYNLTIKKRRELLSKLIKFDENEIRLLENLGYFSESQIDTFIPELYISIQNIFNKMLENEQLEEIHEEIEKFKNYFDIRHSGRKMVFLKDKE